MNVPELKAIELSSWETPATNYPISAVGRARIVRSRYTPGFYECYGLRGHKYYRIQRTIPVTNLTIARKTWMVDDPPHWWAMQEHAGKFRGHVLCAGLGLGMIVHALADNPKVDRITVVEREADVVRLVGPLVPKCEIVTGDFWEWKGKPNGVLFDLFVGDGRDLLPQAIRTMILLAEGFPDSETIRIHGFNNEALSNFRNHFSGAPGTPTPAIQRRLARPLRDQDSSGRTV